MSAVILESVITCPFCGFAKRMSMAVNYCQIFYECEKCNNVMRPKRGDCCVFCSFGSVWCPPMQLSQCGAGPARL